MPDMTLSKQEFANQTQDLARQILLLANNLDALNAAAGVDELSTGAANVFVDADFTGPNAHLSAQKMADGLFAIGTIDGALSTGIRNSLRALLAGGLP